MIENVATKQKIDHRSAIRNEMARREKNRLEAIQRAEQIKRETEERVELSIHKMYGAS